MSSKLIDSDSSDSEEEFKINQDYADKFKKKKINDELCSATTEQEEDEDSEDEEGKLDPDKWNDDFLTLLPMISAKNSKLKEKDMVFFKETDRALKEKNVGEKSLTIKEYQRNKILNQVDNDQYEEEEEEEKDFDSLPHAKQQERLKKEFLKQANKIDEDSDSDDDGFLKKRVKSKEDQEKEEKEFVEFKDKMENIKQKSGVDQKDDIFESFWKGKDTNEDEKYLRDYVVGQKWHSDKGKLPSYEEIMKELEMDEGEVNAQDDFEREFNFRFEEPGAAIIVGNPRNIKSSLRRKDTTRKEKRDKKKERKDTEKIQKAEKIKNIKNEKKKAILEKVKEINDITGSKIFDLDSIDIKKMDPEVMVKAIGKKRKEVSNSDNEDGDYNNDYEEDLGNEFYSNEGGLDINQLIKSGYFDDEVEDDGEVWSNDRMASERKELEDMLDQYYTLDYQDIIDDTPVRFQYSKVDKETFGLSLEDILEKDDKELEKIAPISKIQPYSNNVSKNYKKDYSKRQWDHKSKYHTWSSKTFTSKNNDNKNNDNKNNKFNNNNKYDKNNKYDNNNKNDNKNEKKPEPQNNKRKFDEIKNNNDNQEEKVIKKRKSKNKNTLNK